MIPPRAILAAVSFSPTSRVALVLAARLARHCRAELHVLYVEDPLLDAAAHRAGIDLATHTDRELGRFVADAWPAADCSLQTHVAAGPAVDVILDVARRHRVDLVVVDRGRMSIAERLVFGSTTDALVRRAQVSLLVAPAEWTSHESDASDISDLGPLVTVVDSADEQSVAAAAAACELAAALGTSVEIVEGGAVANRLAEAARPTGNRAPMVVLGKKASRSKRGWTGSIVNRMLSAGTVPILLYVADQIALL